ncbi:MAG: hypothetical protein AVDCRST_MAG06-3200, partial [uncultured Nocardioides sp.]
MTTDLVAQRTDRSRGVVGPVLDPQAGPAVEEEPAHQERPGRDLGAEDATQQGVARQDLRTAAQQHCRDV